MRLLRTNFHPMLWYSFDLRCGNTFDLFLRFVFLGLSRRQHGHVEGQLDGTRAHRAVCNINFCSWQQSAVKQGLYGWRNERHKCFPILIFHPIFTSIPRKGKFDGLFIYAGNSFIFRLVTVFLGNVIVPQRLGDFYLASMCTILWAARWYPECYHVMHPLQHKWTFKRRDSLDISGQQKRTNHKHSNGGFARRSTVVLHAKIETKRQLVHISIDVRLGN